ncbi:MAG: hypothetical protein CFH43_00197 [Proteobacteria bacterium]|nr:MAG: hypothetical protein CFH43_00197 [Pseudomonadota bacterium]
MKKLLCIAIVMSVALLTGCGERVTINTGEVGKELGTNGLEEEIRKPGSFRMDTCIFSACPKLVRLTTAKSAEEVTVAKVFLPKSNVDLTDVTFGMQFRIKDTPESQNQAFEEIKAQVVTDRELIITSDMIFNTFVKRKAPEAVIAALREYSIEDALTSPDTIAIFVLEQVNVALKDTPVELTEFGFPNGVGTPPEEVLTAKRKLYAIDEEKAREIRALQAALEVEKQRQVVQQARVTNDVVNAKTAGVSFVEYVTLKNMERFADAAEAGTPVALGQFSPLQQ